MAALIYRRDALYAVMLLMVGGDAQRLMRFMHIHETTVPAQIDQSVREARF